MEFSRPGYWSVFPSPGYLPNPGIEPRSPALQADSLPTELKENPKIMKAGSAKGKAECRKSILIAPTINPARSNTKTLKLPCSLKNLTRLYF